MFDLNTTSAFLYTFFSFGDKLGIHGKRYCMTLAVIFVVVIVVAVVVVAAVVIIVVVVFGCGAVFGLISILPLQLFLKGHDVDNHSQRKYL